MFTKLLILSCSAALVFGDHHYATKTSKKQFSKTNFQQPSQPQEHQHFGKTNFQQTSQSQQQQQQFSKINPSQPSSTQQQQQQFSKINQQQQQHQFSKINNQQSQQHQQFSKINNQQSQQHQLSKVNRQQPSQSQQQYQQLAKQNYQKPSQTQHFSKTNTQQFSQQPQQYAVPAAPVPYSFNYEADGSSRQESGDGSGKVTGSYSVLNEDGSKRLVKYVADDQGFRAQVDTDEPGTKSDSPANIQLRSSAKAPEVYAAKDIKFSAQGNYRVPMPQQPIMQFNQAPYVDEPAPYSFNYEAQMDDGSSARSESSDGSGRVIGTYSMSNVDGRQRTVDYTADQAGFKASVDTNEFGTKSDSPADVKFFSSASDQVSPVGAQTFAFFPGSSSQASSSTGHHISYSSQNKVEEQYGPISPYEFNYHAELGDGSSSRRESSDGHGTVMGSYDLAVDDGRKRTVEYTADKGGFRATVKTNEFSTKSDSPADVMVYSTATEDEPAPYKSPVSSYRGPEQSYQASSQSFNAPGQSYNAPGQSFNSPGQSYNAPSQSFNAPSQSYNAPGQFFNAPSQSYSAPLEQKALSYQSQESAQFNQAPIAQRPAPYSFDYQSSADQGSSARSESSDASGKVIGSYSLTHEDGTQRVVEYTADEGGFRAKVKTNEVGTKSDSPADVSFHSTAPVNAPSTYGAAFQSGSKFDGQQKIQILKADSPFNAPAYQNKDGCTSGCRFMSSATALKSGQKFEGQQRINVASPSSFKTSSVSLAAQQKPFQISQEQIQQEQYAPSPYEFKYDSEGSARKESADASGKVTGSYSVKNEDGSTRVVDYVADKDGFRAKVKTDEPGTKSDSPADVLLQSSAPEPKPYFPPQLQQQKQASSFDFAAPSYGQKSIMFSQEKIY